MKRFLLFVIALLGLVACGADPSAALAARSKATLTLSPNPVEIGHAFTATLSEPLKLPKRENAFAYLTCYDGTQLVYHQLQPFQGLTANLLAGPSVLMTTGGADCTVEAGYFRRVWRGLVSAPLTIISIKETP